MNKLVKIFLAIIGGCSVLINIMTPLAIVLFWSSYFGLTEVASRIFLVVGGLASLFRAINIGWMKK